MDRVKEEITWICQFKQLMVRRSWEPTGKYQKEEDGENGKDGKLG
jgi:hypothetical protein